MYIYTSIYTSIYLSIYLSSCSARTSFAAVPGSGAPCRFETAARAAARERDQPGGSG